LKSLILAAALSVQVDCLTSAIYHEARGEPYIGQVLVAAVIHNRVLSDHFPGSYCEVIKQDNQFEYVSLGRWNTSNGTDTANRAREIAELMFELDQEPIYNNILFFHSGPIPSFFERLNHEFTVHGHMFYSLPKE
jgi:spore germination cell wall hydrolase CwlJ-like protein